MACDTFIKIAQKCRRHFIQVRMLLLACYRPPPSLLFSFSLCILIVSFFCLQLQPLEVMPFIEEILSNIRAIILCDIQPHHVHTFYEAVGYMI